MPPTKGQNPSTQSPDGTENYDRQISELNDCTKKAIESQSKMTAKQACEKILFGEKVGDVIWTWANSVGECSPKGHDEITKHAS